MQIGVFDSGKGGKLVARQLQKTLPSCTFVVVDDSKNVPYGSRAEQEIIELTETAIQPLLATCPIIVIACNTATTAAIAHLRNTYPRTKFIGIEPMIKPAQATTKTGRFTVLATPHTLASKRYKELKNTFGSMATIDEPDTRDWARKIEDDRAHEIDLSPIVASIDQGSDTLVLACTHYIALKDSLQTSYPAVAVLEPTEAIAQQLARLIAEQS